MGWHEKGGMGCYELPCIHEHNWILAIAWKEMTAGQPQTGNSDLLPNGCVTWDQSLSLYGF